MEDNFRNALIIISAIVIGAIFVHGLWTIRKNKNPYKLKTSDEPVGPDEPTLDKSGFDQYGVGAPRVVEHSALTGEIKNPPQEDQIPEAPAPAPTFNEEPLPQDVSEKDSHIEISATDSVGEPAMAEPIVTEDVLAEPVVSEPSVEAESEFAKVEPSLDLGNEPSITDVEQVDIHDKIEQTIALEPLYETPVTQPKAQSEAKAKKPARKKAEQEALKRNQMGFDFEEDELSSDKQEPTFSSQTSEPEVEKKVEIEPEILILSVVMPENHLMSGAALLPSLLTLGLKFGEMNIFHRHQDNAGNGKVTFSLANLMNPGTFDLDAMESFATQGVSLFMTLPNAGDPFEVFNQMMSAARHLATEFNAQILDDKRCVMTQQTEQHYLTKIREFDRKHRIANK